MWITPGQVKARETKYISLHDDGFLRADKKEAFGWFVKEKFSIKKKADGICLYGWNGCSIVIDEGLRAKEKEEAAVFETEPVKDGGFLCKGNRCPGL